MSEQERESLGETEEAEVEGDGFRVHGGGEPPSTQGERS